MDVFQSVILGLVQGLTEFLPVSSSGHLVLLEKIFGISGDLIFLNVILHLGTLLAVCIFYRKTIWDLLTHPKDKRWLYLFIATIPAVVIVLLFESFVQSTFGGQYLAIGFMLTAAALVAASLVNHSGQGERFFLAKKEKPFNYKSAIVMGIAQGIAVVPGISRSGATISSGIIFGNDKQEVTNFAFLMSIPIILASLVYECFNITPASLAVGVLPLVLGFIFAFIFGYIAIRFMLRVVKKANFWWFAAYLIILSFAMLIFRV